MNQEFEKYIADLATHEQSKSLAMLQDNPREKIKIFAGHRLNWLGDYFGNPDITWEKIIVKISDIRFTGTNPELNTILIDQAERLPSKLTEILEQNSQLKTQIENIATFTDHLLVVRKGPETEKYLILDGTHRLLGHLLQGKQISMFGIR